jgi:hypothetical protein
MTILKGGRTASVAFTLLALASMPPAASAGEVWMTNMQSANVQTRARSSFWQPSQRRRALTT